AGPSPRRVPQKPPPAAPRLFASGGDSGPDITGSPRTSLDYLLENILDPSAVVFGEYQVTQIDLKNGRTLTGIIRREDERSLTLVTLNEKLEVPKNEIASREKSPVSLMPEGLLAALKDDEVRDLFAYLMGPNQVPIKRP